jgi:hypothetical protein
MQLKAIKIIKQMYKLLSIYRNSSVEALTFEASRKSVEIAIVAILKSSSL